MCCPSTRIQQEGAPPKRFTARSSPVGMMVWVGAVALLIGLLIAVPTPGRAHPADMDGDTAHSASQLFAPVQGASPVETIAATEVADPRSDRGVPHLDIAALQVIDGDVLQVVVSLHEAATPEPEGLTIHLLREGDVVAPWIAYQPERGAWGLYELDLESFRYVAIGAASFEQAGTELRVAIPRDDIPADSFLVFARTVGGPDALDQVVDIAPNQRRGLLVPGRGAGSIGPGRSAKASSM